MNIDKDMVAIWILAIIILGDILISTEKPKYTKIIGYSFILIALTLIVLEWFGYILS